MKKNKLYILLITLSSVFYSACSGSSDSGSVSSPDVGGISGSLARFTTNNGNLYVLSAATLITYQIIPDGTLIKAKSSFVGDDSETLFSIGNRLFVGTSSGMRIFSLDTQGMPTFESFYSHVLSCDPVIADSNYAYLTLNNQSSFRCNRGVNRLEVINISDLKKPELEKFYNMTNPQGLAKDGNLLFICDNQLKVYNASNVNNMQLLHTFPVQGNDVIAHNGLLILTADNGLFQYSYDGTNLNYLSSILKEF